MIKYKLTTQRNLTRGNTLWGEGVTRHTSGRGNICGDGWLHFYHTPELSVLLNPVYNDVKDPKLWECRAEGAIIDQHGLKGACSRLTTRRTIELPSFSPEQRVDFGVRCALEVFPAGEFVAWADGWDDKPVSYEPPWNLEEATNPAAQWAGLHAHGAAWSLRYDPVEATKRAALAAVVAAAVAHTLGQDPSFLAENARSVLGDGHRPSRPRVGNLSGDPIVSAIMQEYLRGKRSDLGDDR